MNAILLLLLHVGTWSFVITRNEYYFFPGDTGRWVKFGAWLAPIVGVFGWKVRALAGVLLWPTLPKACARGQQL